MTSCRGVRETNGNDGPKRFLAANERDPARDTSIGYTGAVLEPLVAWRP